MALQHPRPDLLPSRRRTAGPPVDLAVVRPLLRGLDREQRRAVTHREGPLLVLAGPGTGKTEVITRRIAWLIATRRARPSEILALTFTERAADEMQARVDVLVPYGMADTAIGTFHAFGDRLLREHGIELGLPPSPRLVTRPEAVLLLREHAFDIGLDRYRPLGDPARNLGALVDLFGRAKEEGVDPVAFLAVADELGAGARAVLEVAGSDGEAAVGRALLDEAAGQRELAVAYGRYCGLLAERGLIDHADQVALALRLLRERPAVAAEVARRFRYVLVDEGQDANPAQIELVRAVASHGNVTVVGDDDQAIYGFRGAAVASLQALEAAYPAVRRVALRRNYRSRAPILAAAHRLIAHNGSGRLAAREGGDAPLIAVRRGGRPRIVELRSFATLDEEAQGVAAAIAERVAAGTPPRDIAVLTRTNADASSFCRSLELAGVPYRTATSVRLTADPDVRGLLAFLRVVASPGASTDLYAVATSEPYRLGGPDLTRVLEHARRRHRSLWEVLCELVEQPGLLRIGEPARAAVTRLVADLTAAIEASHERPAADVLYAHLRRSGRYQVLVAAAERGDDRPLRRVARLFELLGGLAGLLADARAAVLVPHLDALFESGEGPDADEVEADGGVDAVAVLTVHKAKGLEFPIVFLTGLTEGRFPVRARPHRLALPAALRGAAATVEEPWAEERRLCYVAMTRARDELVLTHASRSSPAGRRRRPSPFIAEALDRVPQEPADAGPVARLVASLASGEPSSPPSAERAASPRTLSYSQLDDLLACPLRYHLRHRVGVPTPPHHALAVGVALHQAVAAYHQAGLRGRTLDEALLVDVLDAHWRAEGFFSREHEEARYASARAALRRFVAVGARAADRVTVAAERPFAVRLGADELRGRYDRVDRGPGGFVITDYKTGEVRDQRHAAERARDSLQLQLYALAWEQETGELPVSLELHFLESGLVGSVSPDAGRLARARETLASAAAAIRAGARDARPDVFTCGGCPYRDICPASAA
jgi:DNA helicase-2/ATP-dependent DNA helicase PcrA